MGLNMLLEKMAIIKLRQEFLTALIEKTKNKTNLFDKVSLPIYTKNPCIAATIKGSVAFAYQILTDKAKVVLAINFSPNVKKTKDKFNILYRDKNDIEKEIGYKLDWQRRDSGKESDILTLFDAGLDYPDWDELQDKMVDAMVKFGKAFLPRLKELGIERKNETYWY
jgi:hypothetical protein